MTTVKRFKPPVSKCSSLHFLMYRRPEFPPLGGSVIKERTFWLIIPIYFVAHSKTLYLCSLSSDESFEIGHAHFLHGFFPLLWKSRKPTFSNSSLAFSPICTKLGTQHLWTLLAKLYSKNFDRPKNTQVIK